jgi:hypothetical protein
MSSRPDPHAAEHALVIAAFQAGDLAGADLVHAEDLLADCSDCASLLADLGTLRAAVRTMPVPPRQRDFRLTEEDVARLQPSGWRRVLAWLAAPRSSVRPLATGLATLGLAGLLLTSVPGLQLFGSATMQSAPAYQVTMGPADAEMATAGPGEPATAGALAAPTQPAPSAMPAGGVPEAPAAAASGEPEPSPAGAVAGSDEGNLAGPRSATPDKASRNAADAALAGEQPGPSLPALASIVLLAAGLGLFAARWAARRARA